MSRRIETQIVKSMVQQHRNRIGDSVSLTIVYDDRNAIIEAAVGGGEVPVIYKGQITQHYKRKSEILRMFVLKARKPEYRDSFHPASLAAPMSLNITFATAPPWEKVIESGAKKTAGVQLDRPQDSAH